MIWVFLQNGIVVDVSRVNPLSIFAPEYATRFIQAPDNVTHNWKFDGVAFTPPDPVPVVEKALQVRGERDYLLSLTDWTQAKDIPNAISSTWVPYRQALRDIPQQPGFPDNVQWPSRPV
jgi:hypothetical protein